MKAPSAVTNTILFKSATLQFILPPFFGGRMSCTVWRILARLLLLALPYRRYIPSGNHRRHRPPRRSRVPAARLTLTNLDAVGSSVTTKRSGAYNSRQQKPATTRSGTRPILKVATTVRPGGPAGRTSHRRPNSLFGRISRKVAVPRRHRRTIDRRGRERIVLSGRSRASPVNTRASARAQPLAGGGLFPASKPIPHVFH